MKCRHSLRTKVFYSAIKLAYYMDSFSLDCFSSSYFEVCVISASLLNVEKVRASVCSAFFINESGLSIWSCSSIPPKLALYFFGLVLFFPFFDFILRRWTALPGFAIINKNRILYLTWQHHHFFNLLFHLLANLN